MLLIILLHFIFQVKDVNIDVDLNEELKCPICLDYLTRPRECSACGHLFCAPCIAHLKSCPLCRIKPFVSRDNRFSSRLVDNIRVNCDKCKAQIFRSQLEEHKKTCENRLRHCIIKDCGFSAASDEEALSHLNTAHKGQLWSTLERLSRTNSPGKSIIYESKLIAPLDKNVYPRAVWKNGNHPKCKIAR